MQGPPGTGKTRTLVALIQTILAANGAVTRQMEALGPILACADTNAATDNLVDGLQQCGVRVVRVGPPAKVSPLAPQAWVDARVDHPDSKLGGIALSRSPWVHSPWC